MRLSAPTGARCVTSRDRRRCLVLQGSSHREPIATAPSLLQAYLERGPSFINEVHGAFAVVLWDSDRDLLLCGRDPFGIQPLFWIEVGARLVFSPSVESLLAQPGFDPAIDRFMLAEHLRHRWTGREATYFDGVHRAPPGEWLVFEGRTRRRERFWDPLPPGQKVEWTEDDVEGHFDRLFTTAVRRDLAGNNAGIFLSGGLDSVGIAVEAARQARLADRAPPHALCLVLPHPECDEETLQRGVASKLGMDLSLIPLSEAVGERGLLAASLELTRVSPAPLFNVWNAAFDHLAATAGRKGCDVVLTGSGGDDWLGLSPFLAADYLAHLRPIALRNLYRSLSSSFRDPPLRLLRMLLGSFGAKALVSATVARIANRLSPELLTRSWRRRIDRHKPGWLAPDPDLARQLFESADRTRPSWPADGFYLRELRRGLRHPLLAWEMEEFGAMGARQGLRVAHPFFDADLVDFLCRVHPDRLLDGGSPNKSLIRRRLSNTFPELGFGAQKKFDATRYFAELVQREAPALWSSLGGATALADLGVVEPRALESEVDTILSSGLAKPRTYYRVWDVLNLETWLRSHS